MLEIGLGLLQFQRVLYSIFFLSRVHLVIAGIDRASLYLPPHLGNFASTYLRSPLHELLFSTPFSTPEKEGGTPDNRQAADININITTTEATSH